MPISFTVFFEDPFWVGLFESTDDGTVKYARVVFGKEPTDAELYDYLKKNYDKLQFSEAVPVTRELKPVTNPKRRQREAGREIHRTSGTKRSWEAAKLLEQQGKKKQKQTGKKALKEEKDSYKYAVKQEKRKEKHRGR